MKWWEFLNILLWNVSYCMCGCVVECILLYVWMCCGMYPTVCGRIVTCVLHHAHILPYTPITSHPSHTLFPFTHPFTFTPPHTHTGDSVSTLIGEVENPTRTVPRALAGAVVLVILAYLIPLLVSLGVTVQGTSWELGYFTYVADKVCVCGGVGYV